MSNYCSFKKNMIQHQLTFTTGEKTCAYEKGKLCQFLRVKHFGTTYYCGYFDQLLFGDKEYGWLQRCPECLETFKTR